MASAENLDSTDDIGSGTDPLSPDEYGKLKFCNLKQKVCNVSRFPKVHKVFEQKLFIAKFQMLYNKRKLFYNFITHRMICVCKFDECL